MCSLKECGQPTGESPTRFGFVCHVIRARKRPAAWPFFLEQQTRRFAERPDEARQLLAAEGGDAKEMPVRAALTFVARVLINVDEFVTRE